MTTTKSMTAIGTQPQTSPARQDSETIRLLLVDDHALLLESLAARLGVEPGFEVVGTVSNAADALDLAAEVLPHIVVMDIDMPGLDCFDATQRLRQRFTQMHVVFLSAYCTDHYLDQAMHVKASGYLTKNDSPTQLADSLRKVAAGETVFSQDVANRLVTEEAGPYLKNRGPSRLQILSQREQEVLRYLAQGLTKREIGKTMHLSIKTIAAHTASLMNKLNIHDRVELARYAIREGLARA